jgi:hypothetical protein
MRCPLCAGTGQAGESAPAVHEETVRRAVALVTLALDHAIAAEEESFTTEELLAVAGDAPLQDMPVLLAMLSSLTACVVRNVAGSNESAREWWSRIAQHIVSGEGA